MDTENSLIKTDTLDDFLLNLGAATPVGAQLQDALASHERLAQLKPELFKKIPYQLTGCDT
jgi:hypothetical protein